MTATATIDARPSLLQHYDTAMRRARLSMPSDAWRELLKVDTRHYKSGVGLRRHRPALAAWLHAIDASPWVTPLPDFPAHVISAYTCTAHSDVSAEVGALALAEDPRARVVQLTTIGEVQAWLQRLGPVVIETAAWPVDYVVKRDTEMLDASGNASYERHVVAAVGIRPDAVRVVNNRGAVWGALGRAWVDTAKLQIMLTQGCAFGVVPVDLVSKAAPK